MEAAPTPPTPSPSRTSAATATCCTPRASRTAAASSSCQMCASVTITPPIQWLQHTTHLVRPVFANDLWGERDDVLRNEVRERARRAWPVAYPPDEANIVFVAPDWSDLEKDGHVVGGTSPGGTGHRENDRGRCSWARGISVPPLKYATGGPW